MEPDNNLIPQKNTDNQSTNKSPNTGGPSSPLPEISTKPPIPKKPETNSGPKLSNPIPPREQKSSTQAAASDYTLDNSDNPNERKNVLSKAKNFLINPLRTYEDDVKNAIGKNKLSKTKILAEEEKKKQLRKKKIDVVIPQKPKPVVKKPEAVIQTMPKRAEIDIANDYEEEEPEQPTQAVKEVKSNLAKVLSSIILIALGAGSLYYVFVYIKPFENINFSFGKFINEELSLNELIKIENRVVIPSDDVVDRNLKIELIKQINQTSSAKANTITEIVVATKTETTDEEGKISSENTKVPVSKIFTILNSQAPDYLIRSLNESDYLIGTYKMENPEPFMLFKTDDFPNTFAGMLEWEESMVRDLRDTFHFTLGYSPRFINTDLSEEVGNTTKEEAMDVATSTSDATVEFVEYIGYDPINFVDTVIKNRDTRAIYNTDGDLLFYYSFLNDNYLLITTNKSVLEEIITRLNSQNLLVR